MVTITACILVKNEEVNLPELLNSILPLTKDIIAVDNGSTDNSYAILSEFGCTIIDGSNYSLDEARNLYLERATGDWLIVIDADQRLEQKCIKKLKSQLLNASDTTWGFEVQNIQYLGNGRWTESFDLKIVRNNHGIQYNRSQIHSSFSPSIYENGGNIERSYCRLHHLDILISDRTNKKREHYKKLLINILNDPNQINKDFIDLYRCFLALEYIAIDEYTNAEKELFTAIYSKSRYCDFAKYCLNQLYIFTNNLDKFENFITNDDISKLKENGIWGKYLFKTNKHKAMEFYKELVSTGSANSEEKLNLAYLYLDVDKLESRKLILEIFKENSFLEKELIYKEGVKPNIFDIQTRLFDEIKNTRDILRQVNLEYLVEIGNNNSDSVYFFNQSNKFNIQRIASKVLENGIDNRIYSNPIPLHERLNDQYFSDKVPKNSTSIDQLIKEFNSNIMNYSSNFASNKFMGFPDSGNSVPGFIGNLYSDILQQNLINQSFCSPKATFIENQTVSWLRQLLGYDNNSSETENPGGIFTYGGTISNVIAIIFAREQHKKYLKEMNIDINNPDNYKVILPDGIDHYSIRGALQWIGLDNQVITVDTLNYRYNYDDLAKTVKNNKSKIMCIVGYAGDSRTQTIDDFKIIRSIINGVRASIWLHADACHGFALSFSEENNDKIIGINLADSIAGDPHKVLMLPYTLSFLLLKEPSKFSLIMTESDLITKTSFSLGKFTPFIGSKNWMSLKLWFLIKNIGVTELGKLIDRRVSMANYLYDQLLKKEKFIVLNKPMYNSVMFMIKPSDMTIDELNSFNDLIYDEMMKDGSYYLHHFSIKDDNHIFDDNIKVQIRPLRFMGGNPIQSYKDIDNLIQYLENTVENILEKDNE